MPHPNTTVVAAVTVPSSVKKLKSRKKKITNNSPHHHNNDNTNRKVAVVHDVQLPIAKYKEKLMEVIMDDNVRVLILTAETACGKSTQVPQYLYEAARILKRRHFKKKRKASEATSTALSPTTTTSSPSSHFSSVTRIAITQPRRVAAITLAKRVAEEMNRGDVGQLVGYSVRFDDTSSERTRIKFMTDGMLVRAAMLCPTLKAYRVIVLDEAHERSLQTDLLFGIVKRALAARDDLKVIVMSATIDTSLFRDFFESTDSTTTPNTSSPTTNLTTSTTAIKGDSLPNQGCGSGVVVMHLPGRQHKVEVFYTQVAQKDYVNATLVTILQLHVKHMGQDGSILVFLTGQEEIETLEALLQDYSHRFFPSSDDNKHNHNHPKRLQVCPIFAAMPAATQMQVFGPTEVGARKIILATNIAETSITINGVRFVIDTGLVKQRSYISSSGIERLAVTPISQAQAWQRAGRAGREAPGMCFRLFKEKSFEQLRATAVSEIKRVNLEVVVLQLKCMGIKDVTSFPFIESPSVAALTRAMQRLFALEALDTSGELTPLGKQMAQFPTSPAFAKVLLSAATLGCGSDALSVIAMLSVEGLLFTPAEKREEANKSRLKFHSFDGDHLTLLNIHTEFLTLGKKKEQNNWCTDHFINFKAMLKVNEIRNQLADHLALLQLPVESAYPELEPVKKALLAGCFLQAAILTQDDELKPAYQALCAFEGKKTMMKVHPSSVLFQRKKLPSYIIYNELVSTTKPYIRTLMTIEREWLIDVAPRFFTTHQAN